MVAPMPTLTPAQPQQAMQPQYVHTDADRERFKRIEAAWQAYDGDLPRPTYTDARRSKRQCNSRIAVVAIVDRGVDFLFGKELEIAVEDAAPDEAQNSLDTTWGRKEQRIPKLQDLAMNGAMAGRAFLRIKPMGKAQNKTYRLVIPDPATISVLTDPQDCETVLLFCTEYSTMQEIDGKMSKVMYREEISRIDPDDDGDDGDPFADTDATWQIQHWTSVGDKGAWTPAGEPIDWPYPFPPLFSCKNFPMPNSFWGKPDITPDIIGMNNSLNLVQSSVNRIEKLFGSPVLWGVGMGQSNTDLAPGKIIGLGTLEGKIVATALPSDTANAMLFADNLRSDIDEQSSVPGVATGRIKDLPRGTMSGVALELLFMALLKKTDKKRMLYGELIIDVCKALFVLAGMSGDIDVELAWQNPLPEDDLPAIQAAIASLELGVSKTTGLRNLGIDPDEEYALTQMEAQRQLNDYARGQALPPTGMTAPVPGASIPSAEIGAPALPGQKYPVPPPATTSATPAPPTGGQA